MGFREVLECSITFHMLLSPSIEFYALFYEFGPSLSYLILILILSLLILSRLSDLPLASWVLVLGYFWWLQISKRLSSCATMLWHKKGGNICQSDNDVKYMIIPWRRWPRPSCFWCRLFNGWGCFKPCWPKPDRLGNIKTTWQSIPTEIKCYDGIGVLYADDTEDLYAEDDLPTGFIHPYAGNRMANPCSGLDKYEDYGEAVFADDKSDGEESVTSFKGDGTIKGRKAIEYYRGMDHDGDDAMADSGEDIGHEKVSICSLSPYYWSDFDTLVCAPHGFQEIRTWILSTVEGVPGQCGETEPGDDAVPSEPPTWPQCHGSPWWQTIKQEALMPCGKEKQP